MAKRTRTARSLAVRMARVCAENRCRDVTVLDLRKLSPVTDFFILATGTSTRQMRTAVQRTVDEGKELGEKPFGVEGITSGRTAADAQWLLIDYVNVVVHVFTDESRTYYDLELLWGDAPRVDWKKGWTPRETDDQPG